MKSFADWTQGIAEANNHEPEPERLPQDPCLCCDGTGRHKGYLSALCQCEVCGGSGEAVHKACSGGCGRSGSCNYGYGDGEYYCGSTPGCCP